MANTFLGKEDVLNSYKLLPCMIILAQGCRDWLLNTREFQRGGASQDG